MYIKNGFSQSTGTTLMELLIALVINIVLLVALVAAIASFMGHYTKSTNADMLNQQLESAMTLMTNDIRRAGYWGSASSDIGTGQNNNPFMTTTTDISVTGGNCILFAYDYDGNGAIPTVASTYDDERYGYRLSGTELQTRPPGSTFSCTAAASNWENVTNSTLVKITSLSFTLNTYTVPAGQTAPAMIIRSVDVSITGQLTSDATVTKTITEHIRVRNDKYVP